MRMIQIIKAVDGSVDWPENMTAAEMAFMLLVYVVTGTILIFGVWATYVVLWAAFG